MVHYSLCGQGLQIAHETTATMSKQGKALASLPATVRSAPCFQKQSPRTSFSPEDHLILVPSGYTLDDLSVVLDAWPYASSHVDAVQR
jgi:RES domain-containing protein